MSKRSEYAPGEFCWVDLATTDVDGAKEFYGHLLGIDAEAAPGDPEETGGYGFFTKDGKMICGFGPTQREEQPSAWSSYIKVEDADETAEQVNEAGGQVHFGPIDLPNESGRMAVLQDPTGAFVCINQQQNHPGAQLVNEPGTWTWNNLMTRDAEAAKDFYGKVFGWTAVHNEEAPPGVSMWQVEGTALAGGSRRPDGDRGWAAGRHARPLAGLLHRRERGRVDRARLRQRRAKLGFGPIDVPVGRLATLVDPQGAVVSMFESHYPEPR